MKTILIIQNYNANKGDSSVVLAMLTSLRARAESSDLTFTVTSYDPMEATREYGVEAGDFALNLREIKLRRGLPRIISAAQEGCWMVYGFLWAFCRRFFQFCLPVPAFKKKTVNLYERADVIVLPGGHFFTNFNGMGMNLSHFYAMMLAFAMRKRTMIYAQTVGPFFGVFKWPVRAMTGFVLRYVDVVTLREKGGLQYCRGVHHLKQTAEIVFALDTDVALAQRVEGLKSARRDGRPLIGVTIHHLYYKHFFTKEQYRDIMADIFRRIVDEYHATILIVPMEEAVHGGGDRPLAQEMVVQSGREKDVFVLEGELSPPVTAAVIASTDLFVGTKTHSIVYGLKGGVPTVSISYQDKSNQFMDMFGLRENAIDMKDLEPVAFMVIFDRVLNSLVSYQHRQNQALMHVKSLAECNNQLLLDLLLHEQHDQ